MDEIVANEEERLVAVAREGVGEAIPEIQLSAHAPALAVGCICLPGDVRLRFGNGFDLGSEFTKEVINSSSEQRVVLTGDDHEQLNKRAGRHTANVDFLDGPGKAVAAGFT